MNSIRHTNLIYNIKYNAYIFAKQTIVMAATCIFIYSSIALAGSIPPPPPCAPPGAPTITASQKPCKPKITEQAEADAKFRLNENSELIKMLSDYIANRNKHHS